MGNQTCYEKAKVISCIKISLYRQKGFVRKNILLRIDQEIEHAEPILLRTEYLEKIDERLKTYLGFDIRLYE